MVMKVIPGVVAIAKVRGSQTGAGREEQCRGVGRGLLYSSLRCSTKQTKSQEAFYTVLVVGYLEEIPHITY
jgi:hypothetical protein